MSTIKVKNYDDLMVYIKDQDYEIDFEQDGMYFYVGDRSFRVNKENVELDDLILIVFEHDLMSFTDDEQIEELIKLGYKVNI